MKSIIRWFFGLDLIDWIFIVFVLVLLGGAAGEAIEFFDKRACRNDDGIVISEGSEWHCVRMR